jgi:hypothetical protein
MLQLPAKGAPSKFILFFIIFRNLNLINANSNITFGAGGKDKNGNSIPGWGYYEVFGIQLLLPNFACLITQFFRQ